MALTMAMAMAMVVTMAKTMSMTEVILVTLFQWMDIDDDKDTGQSMTMLMTMSVLMLILMLMLTGASMARLLTDSDTEAMIQRVQPEERDEVKISIVCFCCLFFVFNESYLACSTDFAPTHTTGECSHREAQRAEKEKVGKLIPTRGSYSGELENSHNEVEPGFTSETPGAEWSADLKWGPAPHRPD